MNAKKILIVEDNPAMLRGLKDNFQAQGYRVRTASDGEKGLEALMRDPPDLVLLDVMLPKVNGYEVCRLARSRRLNVPILMLSAKCRVDDVMRGSAVGADDYMTKPFGIRELMTRARMLSQRGTQAKPPVPTNVASPVSSRRFPLSPSEGERAGVRGPTWGSGPQSASAQPPSEPAL
jgi:DNA-binding response OmpR family regulator